MIPWTNEPQSAKTTTPMGSLDKNDHLLATLTKEYFGPNLTVPKYFLYADQMVYLFQCKNLMQAGGGFAKVTTGRGWLPNDKMQLFFLSFRASSPKTSKLFLLQTDVWQMVMIITILKDMGRSPKKSSCSFGVCPNYLDPPDPPPNLDNLYHFFLMPMCQKIWAGVSPSLLTSSPN